MGIYGGLPLPESSWIRLGEKKSNQVKPQITRREVIDIATTSIMDLGLHLTTSFIKFTAAIIPLPVDRILRGVPRRIVLVDAGWHLVRAIKIAVLTPYALLAGLMHPVWSISLYRKFALIQESPKLSDLQNAVASIRERVTRKQMIEGYAGFVAMVMAGHWYFQGRQAKAIVHQSFG